MKSDKTHSEGETFELQSRPVAPLPAIERLRPVAQPSVDECTHPAKGLEPLFPATDFITGHKFEVARCSSCGLSVTSPWPGYREIANYYPVGYYGALGARRFPRIVEALQKALYQHRARAVESIADKPGGRVLDIGCGRGWLLDAFRRRGWNVQGTELSDGAARYAREALGIPVETGSLQEIRFPANHFDALTMWHVLEHVPDPRTMLAEAARILKPGGALFISVPNFGGLEARWFRDKWFHLDVPRHVTHLTQEVLREALAEAGFVGVRWSGLAPEYDIFSFVQSALNRCGLRHNLLYDLLRGKRAKVIENSRAPYWQMAASLALGAVFGMIAIPLTFLTGLLNKGGTMTVLAVKGAQASAELRPDWRLSVETSR